MSNRRKRRLNIAQTIVDELMFRNRHTCCICQIVSKDVQIHHIDSNHSNNEIDNLAVVCLDCHSRITGDRGLGRRYTPGEVRKYKWEWERLTMSKLETTSPLSEVEKSMIRADIARLTVEVISLSDNKRRLEALEQIEAYYVYFDL